jgi:hypothetical protein
MPRLITSYSSIQQIDPMVYAWVAVDTTSLSNNSVSTIGLSTANNAVNNRFVVDGTNERLTPLIKGRYMCFFSWGSSGTGSAGYSVVTYIAKNGNNIRSHSGIRSYAGSSSPDSPLVVTTTSMNGACSKVGPSVIMRPSVSYSGTSASALFANMFVAIP